MADSIPVMLLFVLESKGSSPGRQGFNMAVASDGELCGTIGGGIMEHKFVEMAKARVRQNADQAEVYKQVHDKNAAKDQSGMICSGEQTIFIYQLLEQDSNAIVQLVESLVRNENGRLQITPTGMTFSNEIPELDFYFKQEADGEFLFIEKTGYKNHLHIIGGGHCALALSRLMAGLDFYIHVYDERAGLNTMNANSFAHAKSVVNSYTELSDLIPQGDHVYVVIMTFGYRSDDIALRSLMNKQFKYIGMLGSRNKITKMLFDYRKENINEDILKQVHAPIGIQIKSQRAEEIAVSIAAEIIAIRNKDQ
ncbi:MAG: XdhC family protein [Ferruginibacter sp.]